jgi:NADPH2:quinone reductase
MPQSRAIRIHQTGGPEVLKYEVIEVAAPLPGEVQIRHKAIGLNFTDIHHRTGRYPVPGFPAVLGMEGVGVVEAVGAGVTEFEPGDRVAYAGASPWLQPGSYSDLRNIDSKWLVKIPDWLDFESAAAAFLKGLTAQYLLRGAFRVQKGMTILIHAVSGGVGLLMTQWAKHLGAVVIGTASSEAKADAARQNGADHVLLSTSDDVAARVRALTGGLGVAAVYDSVGAATFEITLACLRKRGMAVCFGTASGPVPPLEIWRLNRMGSLYITGAGLNDYISDRAELLERAADLFEVLKSGAVKASINQRYRLEDAAHAHHDLESRRTTGSSILTL